MRVQRMVWAITLWLPWSLVAAQQPSVTGFSGIASAAQIGPYVANAAPAAPGSFDEVDRTVEREHQVTAQLGALHPMVETTCRA